MNKTILAVLCCAGGVAAFGQELALNDDFSRYADGAPPAEAWDVLGGAGHWRMASKQLVADANAGLCQFRKAPELEALDFSAQVVVTPGPASKDWKTAGVAIILDGRNHWRLNLVEGPDGKRYTEFGETYAGNWQAQRAAGTQLRALKSTMGVWNFGVAYRLRIKLSAQEISGEVAEVAGGKIIASYRYAWDGAEGVKFGRPGFSANGLALRVASLNVTLPLPSPAANAPAIESGAAGRVALVTDLPGGTRANTDALAVAFRRAGFGVTPLSGAELASPALFSALNFDAVILAGSRYFPDQACDNFLRFLRNGGHCVVLGGNIFEDTVARVEGRWYARADVERELAATKIETPLLDPAQQGKGTWWHSSDVPQVKSAVTVEGNSFRFETKGLKGWDTFNTKISAPPPGQTLFCFRAKGDAVTPQVTVEVDEQDGSRWVATVDLAQSWQNYALAPDRFAQWDAKVAKKNSFTPANAAKLCFGLAMNFSPHMAKGAHTYWVESIGMASNRLAQIDLSHKVDLNIFYDYEPYHLQNVVSVGASPCNNLTPHSAPVTGNFGGLAAIGFAFPNESKFVPLLSTFDQYGRDCGWAAGMLINYAGTYRGSSWIFSGITNQAFYAAPAVLDTLAAALKAARGNLAAARVANALPRQSNLMTRPVPQGFIRRSPDGKHLVHPDGRRFFMSGCNYTGPFDRCHGRIWRDEFFSAADVEEDFRKAHAAGLNCMRYWVSQMDADVTAGDFRKVDAIRECARKYGIYLLLDLPGTSLGSVEEMVASHKAIADAFKDEPMVIGYDLRNEPYISTVASLRYGDGEKPQVTTTDFLAKHGDLVSRKQVTNAVALRPDWLRLPRAISGAAAENATAAVMLWSQYTRRHQIGSATTVGLDRELPADAEFSDLIAAVNQSFDLWSRLQIAAIRSVDTNHLITIGYDTALTALPCNRQLDFVSQHVYARPYSLSNVLENVTELDRLATVWPDKPITFGEFGYSTGVPMPDGYLDRYTASVGEMIHYLYAFTKNYDGVKKWMLNDWPRKIMHHYGDWNKGETTRIYEERFGLFYYDGTPTGRPKPIAHALRFFGEHLAGTAPSGTLEIVPATLSIGAGYVYRNKQALFIGNTTYTSDALTFTAAQPANVMLRWDADGLRVMSSADAHVTLKPTAFRPFGKAVTGRHGALRADGDALVVDLLEGETLLIK